MIEINQFQHPSLVDISLPLITIGGKNFKTTLKIVKFLDRTLIFITNLGRVGHIIEISFLALCQTPGVQFSGRAVHHEARTLLGPDTVSC